MRRILIICRAGPGVPELVCGGYSLTAVPPWVSWLTHTGLGAG